MNLRILSLLLITIIFSNCKKTNTPTTSSAQQVKLDHGQPTGPATQQTIGASGGTLTSPDGVLTLTIPGGAVETNTNFSIQPVQNVLQSRGGAYRLAPETVFKKPITITISYASANIRPEEANTLFPVYQDAAGNFYQPKNIQHNATTKTLTVETTHFSDWTFTSRIELQVQGHVNNGTVELHGGESSTFTLVKYYTDDKTADAYQDGVPLLADPTFGLTAKISWTKTSNTGALSADKATARYTAPASITDEESLLVTATVEDNNLGKDNTGQVIRQMILSQPVVLVPEDADFFELTEDGTTYRSTNPHFTVNGFMTAIGDLQGRSITLSVRGANAAGSYTYGEPGLVGKATIDYTGDNSVFVHFRYDDCANPHGIYYCPGTFNVTKVANAIGEYSEGTFSGEIYAYDYCQSQRKKVVSGRFKVRKKF